MRLATLLTIISCISLFTAFAVDPADVTALQYSAKGNTVAVGYKDGKVTLLKSNSGDLAWSTRATGRSVSSVHFRKKDAQILVFERHGSIRCIDAATGADIKKLSPNFLMSRNSVDERLSLADFDHHDDLIALAGEFTPVIYLVDAEQALNGPTDLVLSDAYRYEDNTTGTAIGLPTRGFKNISSQSAAVVAELYADGNEGFDTMRVSSRSGIALAVDKDQLLFVWKIDSSRQRKPRVDLSPTLRKFGRSGGGQTGLAVSDRGDFVTVGYTKQLGGVQLWKAGQAEMINWVEYRHPGGLANRAVFNHSGNAVITSDEVVDCMWKNVDGKLEQSGTFSHGGVTGINERPNAIAFSPDDKQVAIGIGPSVAVADVSNVDELTYIGPNKPEEVDRKTTLPKRSDGY